MNPNTTALTPAEHVATLGTLELVQMFRSFRRFTDGDAPQWADLARRRLVEMHGAEFVDALGKDDGKTD